LFILAASLQAAHHYRAGNFVLVALSLLCPLLFFWKVRWSLLLLQLAAYAACINWLSVAVELVQLRQQLGRPWLTAVLILAAVAAASLLAGLLLNTPGMRRRYPH